MAQGYDSGALDEPRLRELIEVGRSLVAELDPEVVFRRLLEVACELTGARYAALGVLDENRHELERFITHGIGEEERRAIGNLPRGRGVLGLLIEQPRALRLSDVGHHPRSYGFPPGHPPMTTFLGVPVMIRGHAWGNLYLTEKDSGEFDEADEQSALILAEWAGIAVENARLYHSVESQRDELERAVHQLEATTEIARAVGGETDLERILETVVKRGRALVEARSLLILLCEHEHFVPASMAGEQAEHLSQARIPIAGSIPGQVLEAREPRRIQDLDPSLMARPGHQETGVTALLVPLVYRGQSLGVLVALEPLGPDGFSDDDEQVLVPFAASAATAVAMAKSVAEDRTRDSIAATERERGRWARELHDESLQSLAGLRVLLSRARRCEPDMLDALLEQGIEHVDSAIAEMRRLIADLRPTVLDELGLGPALEALGERTVTAGVLDVEMNVDLDVHDGEEGRLVTEVEDTVFRLVQEALNNVVRHGETDSARVDVTDSGETLRVRVSDSGRGFDPSAKSDGFGLIGMRERVELAGGELDLRSKPGEGTTVEATLPARHRGADSAAA
jgi:two-component system, NarL family, sensor histidine kinase DevS